MIQIIANLSRNESYLGPKKYNINGIPPSAKEINPKRLDDLYVNDIKLNGLIVCLNITQLTNLGLDYDIMDDIRGEGPLRR